MKDMEKFVLQKEKPKNKKRLSTTVSLSPHCFIKVEKLKEETGLPMARIIEQCVDFALDRLEDNKKPSSSRKIKNIM